VAMDGKKGSTPVSDKAPAGKRVCLEAKTRGWEVEREGVDQKKIKRDRGESEKDRKETYKLGPAQGNKRCRRKKRGDRAWFEKKKKRAGGEKTANGAKACTAGGGQRPD